MFFSVRKCNVISELFNNPDGVFTDYAIFNLSIYYLVIFLRSPLFLTS